MNNINIINIKRITSTILVMMLITASALAGATYYVDDSSGSNSNPGTKAQPWKTIQKAANTLQAGDTVIVNPGTYNERVVINNSGRSGALISFTASTSGTVQCQGFTIRSNYIYIKGFKVVAVEGTWSAPGYGIWVEGDNCIIERNYAYYCPTGGIVTTKTSASCEICNNRCHRNGLNGIEIDGVNHRIISNEIWGTISYHASTNWNPSNDANGFQYWGSGHIFRGNYIHDISFNDPGNVGYSPHIDAFQTWGTGWHLETNNILFDRNLIILTEYKTQSATSHAFMLQDASNITIRNNILIAHGGTETGGGGGTCHNLRIENNTFVGTMATIYWPLGISLENCPNSTIKNNIIYNQAKYAIYLTGSTYTGLDIGYNCIYNSNGTTPLVSSGAIQPTDLWDTNPQFVNASNRDYHLQSNSLCIDAGAAISSVNRDYEGNPRPLLNTWDIGAYEYNGAEAHFSVTINASATSGAAPLTVNFNGSASGGSPPYFYEWTFGDGDSSTAQNPSHTYSMVDTFTATLTVTDSESDTKSKSITIYVFDSYNMPNVVVSANPTSGQPPLTVNFTGSATGGTPPYSYSWDFGDSASSTAQNPSHTYSSNGNYTATLTVTDSMYASGSASININVAEVVFSLALDIETGAPASGQGGTTDPSPGTHTFTLGSNVSVQAISSTDYRFSNWEGDVAQSSIFSPSINLIMNNNKSISATFCSKCADVNGDLEITPSDAQSAFDIFLQRKTNPTWCEQENADVNGSGTNLIPEVTPADAQMIFNIYLQKGIETSDCSGASRAASLSTQNMIFSDVYLTINDVVVSSGQDISIPIIVESPSEITAFGFDLEFPSDVLTFIGLERTELTENYEQLDATVISYRALNRDWFAIGPEETRYSGFNPPLVSKITAPQTIDDPDIDTTHYKTLRVGGYKTDAAQNPSYGVLVTLVFRVTGKAENPIPFSITTTYDDLKNATIRGGMINRQNNSLIIEDKRPHRNIKKKP